MAFMCNAYRDNAMARFLILALLSMLVTACSANWNSIYRTHKFAIDERSKDAESVIVDIQQREVLVGNGTICPAPSPDALAAYAAQLAAKGEVPSGAKGEIAAAVQTSAAYVGVRSRNIQFFRDQLYSFCLDRMNDTLDDAQYNFYKSRLQRYAVTLAAVEQLTDSAIAPPVVLGSNGGAAVSGNLDTLNARLQTITKEIEEIESSGGPNGDGQQLSDEEKARVKELTNSKKATEKQIYDSTLLSASGQSSGQIGQYSASNVQGNSDAIKAVTKIVISTLMTDDTPLFCLERLINLENRPYEESNYPDGTRLVRRPPLDEAELVEVEYCKSVLMSSAGGANPMHKLDPELRQWLLSD